MRDRFGAHVSAVDWRGDAADIDGVVALCHVIGSFRVEYNQLVDRVCLTLSPSGRVNELSLQLTLAQAELLRNLLDAGIADALAAGKPVLPAAPNGGAA